MQCKHFTVPGCPIICLYLCRYLQLFEKFIFIFKSTWWVNLITPVRWIPILLIENPLFRYDILLAIPANLAMRGLNFPFCWYIIQDASYIHIFMYLHHYNFVIFKYHGIQPFRPFCLLRIVSTAWSLACPRLIIRIWSLNI